MFEKSLYDLIRGLRNHKGNEREYIQESLRECRREVRGKDMNLKATALLKITYLEMFGHDMSWASFNVLEVMSSQTYVQKRVGYLAAIQSFRPDTEVLMLAENLLKKDLSSSIPIVISLPLVAIPHVINPSMANSLLSDLLPRLTHSHAAIRKKTIVTLYRLALVYPETLRPAWPKIKERLLDETEDPSVTSAIFATLTPLEPRLIKKLLPPLTDIINKTPAMSLLYECINGIVQGGILDASNGTTDGEQIARLCVGKLRSMLVVEGDPNLKFVALLAFQKIVISHPHLVSLHQDVILTCIDDADISIRMRALDLAVGMVNSDNLSMIVETLVRQLINAPVAPLVDDTANDRGMHAGVEPLAESDDEDDEESLRDREIKSTQPPPLPEDYRINAIRSILEICARNTYANINDFEWYIAILVKLIKACPPVKINGGDDIDSATNSTAHDRDISYDIGSELQNVAARVKSMRPEATAAAQAVLTIDTRDQFFPASGNGGQGVLGSCAWIVGEYADQLTDPEGVLNSLLHSQSFQLPADILAIYVHAVLKVFALLCGNQEVSWAPARRTNLTLSMARIVYFLEPLASHPDLDVQERAVEYLELMKLTSEAASSHTVSSEEEGGFAEPPLLLTQAFPALFTGMELNPVAAGALRKVPPPDNLDLNVPINESLSDILREADEDDLAQDIHDEFQIFYSERMDTATLLQPESAAERLDLAGRSEVSSYQNTNDDDRGLDAESLARKRLERSERNRDDPFYIGGGHPDDDDALPSFSRLHNIIENANGEDDVDIDSIPIMDLDLGSGSRSGSGTPADQEFLQRQERARKGAALAKRRKRVEILGDETIVNLHDDASQLPNPSTTTVSTTSSSFSSKSKKALLQVDSSGLGNLISLESDPFSGNGKRQGGILDIEQREEEERALREVERLRLEMQRASERILAQEESVVVKRKKVAKKKKKVGDQSEGNEFTGSSALIDYNDGHEDAVVKKLKKKKKVVGDESGAVDEAATAPTKILDKPKKKKKRRQIDINVEKAAV